MHYLDFYFRINKTNCIIRTYFNKHFRKHFEHAKEKRSLQYATISSSSLREQAATNESHPYQELEVAGNTYNNLTLNAS